MKSTGIVRRIDDLGRLVLPAELRRVLDLGERAEVEIYTENDAVILRRYQPTCTFCGGAEELLDYCGRPVCAACRKKLGELGK